jgi:hypothetical protein
MASAADLSVLNELLEETCQCAEESGAASDLGSFKQFVEDMIPFDVLELLYNEANASLEDIWEEKYNIATASADEFKVDEASCEICEREINLTRHHLIPREMHERVAKKTGATKDYLNRTISVCRMCHSSIHRFFTNSQLAESYHTLDALMEDERMVKYAKWASSLSGRGNKRVH